MASTSRWPVRRPPVVPEKFVASDFLFSYRLATVTNTAGCPAPDCANSHGIISACPKSRESDSYLSSARRADDNLVCSQGAQSAGRGRRLQDGVLGQPRRHTTGLGQLLLRKPRQARDVPGLWRSGQSAVPVFAPLGRLPHRCTCLQQYYDIFKKLCPDAYAYACSSARAFRTRIFSVLISAP